MLESANQVQVFAKGRTGCKDVLALDCSHWINKVIKKCENTTEGTLLKLLHNILMEIEF